MAHAHIDGSLAVTRKVKSYSPELVKLAEEEGAPLPPFPADLSVKAEKKLHEIYGSSEFTFFLSAKINPYDNSLNKVNLDGGSDKAILASGIQKVLDIYAEDGCSADGEFSVIGADQGDVERWIIEDNVLTKETVKMVWPDGSEFRYHKPTMRW
jgi:hypothetical protein